jgi:hypothetical protein
MSGGGAGAAVPGPAAMGGAPWALGAAPGGAVGGAAGGALGGLGAAGGAPAGGMDMAGGWQMPGITGGAGSLYAAPGATGAMNPGAPSGPNWLQRNPQAREALLRFGQSLLEQRAPGGAGPGGPGPGISRGQWQPPLQLPQMPPMARSGLPRSSSLAGPDTGAYGGAIGGLQPYGGYGPFWGGR